MKNVVVGAIEMDASIQCRATIDTATVDEYAERMTEGDSFPPMDVYGTVERCWIGDGWHRALAALQCGFLDIPAVLHEGGRVEALRHALGANALHGRRRTNADKRRSVEIALREFPGLSSRQIAEMCGVGDDLVLAMKPQVPENDTSSVTGRDGKEYPARRQAQPTETAREEPTSEPRPTPTLGPPRNGLGFARLAIMDLEQIRADDVEREQAFSRVREWLDGHQG